MQNPCLYLISWQPGQRNSRWKMWHCSNWFDFVRKKHIKTSTGARLVAQARAMSKEISRLCHQLPPPPPNNVKVWMELGISEKYWIYSNYSKVQSLIYVLVICVAFTQYCILFINGFIVGRSEDTALLRTHCQNCWDDFFFISLFKLTQRGVEFFVLSPSLF